jgi:hypothetical protein
VGFPGEDVGDRVHVAAHALDLHQREDDGQDHQSEDEPEGQSQPTADLQ